GGAVGRPGALPPADAPFLGRRRADLLAAAGHGPARPRAAGRRPRGLRRLADRAAGGYHLPEPRALGAGPRVGGAGVGDDGHALAAAAVRLPRRPGPHAVAQDAAAAPAGGGAGPAAHPRTAGDRPAVGVAHGHRPAGGVAAPRTDRGGL